MLSVAVGQTKQNSSSAEGFKLKVESSVRAIVADKMWHNLW